MPPGQKTGLLTHLALGIAPHFLVISNVGLLEIGAASHNQQFEGVFVVGPPINLRSGTGAIAKIKQLLGLWRIQVATGSEAVDKKVVTDVADLPAIISVDVLVVDRCAAEASAD